MTGAGHGTALPLNPFHADFFVRPAEARLMRRPVTRLAAGGASLPVTREARLGRVPVPHAAGLHHDHCFLGTPELAPGASLAALLRAAPGPALHLRAVPEDGCVHSALASVPGARVLSTRRRALLRRGATFEAHLGDALRGKKRKELRRQRTRLEESGALAEERFGGADLAAWTEGFLVLESKGWKGEAGTAMAVRAEEAAFLREALAGADAAGTLAMWRLTLDGEPIAQVVALKAGDGGLYTYKIAHDPALARYSPGVLVMLTLTRDVLDGTTFAYADSCAAEGHPMIEHLWRDKRVLHDWLVPTNAAGRLLASAMGLAGKAARP